VCFMTYGRRGKTTRKTVLKARALRQEMTPAETKLCEALRGRKLAGLKFRRQHPYAQYILDNYCVEKRLVVEADGGVHLELEQAAHDQARSEFLATEGILVLRFPNEMILSHLETVLKQISEVAGAR